MIVCLVQVIQFALCWLDRELPLLTTHTHARMHACTHACMHTCTHTHTHTHTQAVARKERCRVEEAQHFVLTSGSQLEVRGSLTNPITDWEIEPRGRGDVSWRTREGIMSSKYVTQY